MSSIKENFRRMRKSRCALCDGWGIVTVMHNGEEVAKACTCNAGYSQSNQMLKFFPIFEELKYPTDLKLTEAENEIFLKLIKNKNVKLAELCPF